MCADLDLSHETLNSLRLPSTLPSDSCLRIMAVLVVCVASILGDSENAGGGRDVGAKRKRRVGGSGDGRRKGAGQAEGDAPKRRGAATKAPKRSKPLHPYVEVEYEEETEDAAAESMSFNW